ncbi:hypothetical protein C4J81_06015 [Deltaproteobacteria bacterium Smac51]|nr:hypothetical protein C4J81_06015 [Deltaproteobacteria bacterium Smac51]
MSINSPSFSFLNFLKKLSIGYVYFLSILILMVLWHFYISESFKPSESIWLLIRCFLLPELIFSRETLYAVTSDDPFILLIIQIVISPYYISYIIYAHAVSTGVGQIDMKSKFHSPLIASFSIIMIPIAVLVVMCTFVFSGHYIAASDFVIRAWKVGFFNIVPFFGQYVATRKNSYKILKGSEILTIFINSVGLALLLNGLLEEVSRSFVL